MKTIRTKEIDGFVVVTGIGVPSIDPVESAKISGPLLMETDEKTEFNELIKNLKNIPPEERAGYEERCRAAHAALMTKKSELFEANLVYCHPRKGETIAADGDGATMLGKLKNLTPGHVLLEDGAELEDLRGIIEWQRSNGVWNSRALTSLGEELSGGWIPADDLTAEDVAEIVAQRNTERIAGLSTEQKEAEKEEVLRFAAEGAALIRSMMEIKGEENALTTCQDLYADRVTEIEGLYS